MAAVIKIDSYVRELIVSRGNVPYVKWWNLIYACMQTRLNGAPMEPYIPYIYLQIAEDDRAGLKPDCTLAELESHIRSLDRDAGTLADANWGRGCFQN